MEGPDTRWDETVHRVFVIVLSVLVGLSAVQLLCLPDNALLGSIVVDDALYYAIPARHLVESGVYSFDGEKRTNGVQPLWALVVVVLAAITPDDALLVRLMAVGAAGCWFAAAVVLYGALRVYDRWMALLAAAGWATAAFTSRVAFQGMENGLHALLAALLLWFGVRWLRRPPAAVSAASFYLLLGLLLALFTLARVDSGLLALLVGAAVLAGFIDPSGVARPHVNLSGALLLALPGVVLVGGYVLLSAVYFGTPTPVSGAVKLHLEREWGPLHGGLWDEIIWHSRFVFGLATASLAQHLDVLWWRWFHVPEMARLCRGAIALLLSAGVLTALGRGIAELLRRRASIVTSWRVLAALLLVFVVARFAIYAISLPHFTGYCTWYFAPEIMLLWVLTAASLYGLGVLPRELLRRLGKRVGHAPGRVLCIAALILLTLAALRLPRMIIPSGAHTQAFATGGRWINEHIAATESIAAFSAGILAYAAPEHQVVNLDGLMNDVDYYRNYLSKTRIVEYAEARGIGYFCDYAPLDDWRRGGFWGFRMADMRLVRWWRMEGDLAYCLWELPVAGETPRRYDGRIIDRLSQLQYDAEVGQQYQVLSEDEWRETLAREPETTRRVLASIPVWPRFDLRHVVATAEQAARWQPDPLELDIPTRRGVVFGGEIELVGYDVPRRSLWRGDKLLMTRFWRRVAESAQRDVQVETRLTSSIDGGAPTVVHTDTGCHGSYPVRDWPLGVVVVETYAIDVPATMRSGGAQLTLGLHDETGAWLAAGTAGNSTPESMCFVANVRIE